ncbi:MAG: phosphatase PAP2 family protein [Bacteroidales bacterium]|nr:phosphatase PAP2 family protein [Candidatus Sodaliphilus aphodohippi]
MKNLTLVITILLALMTAKVQAQICTSSEIPNSLRYMPGPPDLYDTRFESDIKAYFNGKTVRNTKPRGEQIKTDAGYGTATLAATFSDQMGFVINQTNSPKLWRFINDIATTGGYLCNQTKNLYARIRPCVRFNENPYSSETLREMRSSYSYPSAHTATAWCVGLTMAALNPAKQDTLLSRAYQYCQSRVYGGMHWQSDVDDARHMSAACLARMLAAPDFFNRFELSRNEIAANTAPDSTATPAEGPRRVDGDDYFAPANMPDVLRFLPVPQDGQSPERAYDLDRHLWGKAQRETERGTIARINACNNNAVIISDMEYLIHQNINPGVMPSTYQMLETALNAAENACVTAQQHYMRKHPFEVFNEDPYTFEDKNEIAATGSYPSVNAAKGWLAALTMVAVAPEQQDSILLEGYQLGDNNIIAGINWQSDVDAGRLVAEAVLARLISNPDFVALLQQAQLEYLGLQNNPITDEEDIKATLGKVANDQEFTIDGRPATRDSRGVIVGRHRKVLR